MTIRDRLRLQTSGVLVLVASATAAGNGPRPLAAASALASGAGRPASAHVAIVLDVPTPLPTRQLRAMTEETAAIWHQYNVGISWLSRDDGGIGPEDVRIVVRLVQGMSVVPDRSGGSRGETGVIGVIQFVDGIPDGVITLSPEAIEAVIVAVGWNGRPLAGWPVAVREDLAGRALGRALAHELGHYLLAQRTHTRVGLMKATFKGSELLEANRRRFELQPGDLAALLPRIARLADGRHR